MSTIREMPTPIRHLKEYDCVYELNQIFGCLPFFQIFLVIKNATIQIVSSLSFSCPPGARNVWPWQHKCKSDRQQLQSRLYSFQIGCLFDCARL